MLRGRSSQLHLSAMPAVRFEMASAQDVARILQSSSLDPTYIPDPEVAIESRLFFRISRMRRPIVVNVAVPHSCHERVFLGVAPNLSNCNPTLQACKLASRIAEGDVFAAEEILAQGVVTTDDAVVKRHDSSTESSEEEHHVLGEARTALTATLPERPLPTPTNGHLLQ
jgi:hypothetical protein